MVACSNFAPARSKAAVDDVTDDLLRSTSVILLANAAHYSALNTRKRLVISGRRSVEDELRFTALLLSEQQAAKSSFLWHHRRWLMARIREPLDPENLIAQPKLSLSDVSAEVALANRACDRYPRNYFAWHHRQLCVVSAAASSPSEQAIAFLENDLEEVRHWIGQHVGDHSAVHYVCNVLVTLRPHKTAFEKQSRATLSHALSLLEIVPDHESLWLLLRRLLVTVPEDIQVEFVEQLAGLQASSGGHGHVELSQGRLHTLNHAERAAYWRANIATPGDGNTE